MSKTRNSPYETQPFLPPEDINYARRLCARRELSPLGLSRKLERKGVPSSRRTAIINKLQSENFLSEERFAHAFTHDKSHLQAWSYLRIKRALQAENIPTAIIEKCLPTSQSPQFQQNLEKALQRRLAKIKSRTIAERQKLIRQLQRQGFGTDEILSAINRVW
ncbi:MAG: RecX family transcriptional regulator [Flavobacteriales bacterium]|nr:RecX family transcriptional regulator [Flavobacteriales bacterium]